MPPHVLKRVCFILCFIALAAGADAEDWPQWRGSGRDGVWRETGIRKSFPAEGLPVRWRAAVGHGFSSPVIAQGRVYVTDALVDRPKVTGRILCFEEATGKLLWTFSREKTGYPDWAFVPGQEPSPYATPVVHGGKIFATGPQAHHLYCLEAASGELVWERDLARDYQIEETATIGASPLVDGDRLILQVGGKPGACVVAFDLKSGRELWKSLDEQGGHASPIMIQAGGRRQLIVWTTQSVSSLDPATGNVFWREALATGPSGAIATPVFADHWLLVSGLMFKLDERNPSASVLWPASPAVARRFLSVMSTPVIQGNHVYSLNQDGNLVCRDAETGRQIWASDKVTQPKDGNSACMHMTVNGSSVFIYNEVGELILAQLAPEGYQEIARTTLLVPSYQFGRRKVTWAAPSFANGQVFARNERELVCASLAAPANDTPVK